MRGMITNINYRTGLAEVQIYKDCFSVFEMMGATVDVGQEISGDLASTGAITVKNLARNMDMEIYILEPRCSAMRASELLQWHVTLSTA